MKKTTLLTILICAAIFTGCSKSEEEVVAENVKVARLLTGIGNRYWHLKEIYVDNVMQTLTDYQKSYTKTYTINAATQVSGTFHNSDNLSGTWEMDKTGASWKESFTSNGGVPVELVYSVKSITGSSIDASYTAKNGKLVREVYYAY
ncbi:hypothetical protein GWC95_04885 [Sediminibacterium roseum]|uniref:Lipocalin-like domain-containing protein n=1 Tax=Sediminibacterium roseum TaxID=1978412 RepID=A0ABW9ZQ84_9BACT|nr:hypothetical protein [Sediminibacterium roseum]NCI49248.1 hypothetical protein [Sediminibacterium roseum]